jgi:hypothetical protein
MKAYVFRKNYKEFFMKKAVVFLMVLSFVVAMSCGSGPAPSNNPNDPPWINDVPPEDVIWGIGIAKMQNAQQNLPVSERRGRVAIAEQLNSKVQSMFTDYNLEAGPAGNAASTSLVESVSRSVTNMDVSGARRINTWTGPDGTRWTLMEYKKSDAKAQIASILGNQEAQYAQFKAQQALDMLDAQLAKNDPAARNSSN